MDVLGLGLTRHVFFFFVRMYITPSHRIIGRTTFCFCLCVCFGVPVARPCVLGLQT